MAFLFPQFECKANHILPSIQKMTQSLYSVGPSCVFRCYGGIYIWVARIHNHHGTFIRREDQQTQSCQPMPNMSHVPNLTDCILAFFLWTHIHDSLTQIPWPLVCTLHCSMNMYIGLSGLTSWTCPEPQPPDPGLCFLKQIVVAGLFGFLSE